MSTNVVRLHFIALSSLAASIGACLLPEDIDTPVLRYEYADECSTECVVERAIGVGAEAWVIVSPTDQDADELVATVDGANATLVGFEGVFTCDGEYGDDPSYTVEFGEPCKDGYEIGDVHYIARIHADTSGPVGLTIAYKDGETIDVVDLQAAEATEVSVGDPYDALQDLVIGVGEKARFDTFFSAGSLDVEISDGVTFTIADESIASLSDTFDDASYVPSDLVLVGEMPGSTTVTVQHGSVSRDYLVIVSAE